MGYIIRLETVLRDRQRNTRKQRGQKRVIIFKVVIIIGLIILLLWTP